MHSFFDEPKPTLSQVGLGFLFINFTLRRAHTKTKYIKHIESDYLIES